MTLRYFTIGSLCVWLVLAPSTGEAARTALFILQGFEQWVDLEYHLSALQSDSHGRSSSSSSQRVGEGYGFRLDYALYNPRILRGSLLAGVDLEQRESSSTTTTRSNEAKVTYNINGLILDRSDFPSSFYSSMDTSYVQQPFLPSYTLTTITNGYSLSLNNKFVPVFFSFNDTSTSTSGLQSDLTQDTTSLSVSLINNLYNVFQTSLSVADMHGRNSVNGSTTTSKVTTLKVGNTVNFSLVDYYRTLTSQLQYDKAVYQDDRTTLWWNETLSYDLGRALRSQVDYQYTSRQFNGGDDRSQRLHGALRHKLYQSLITELNGQAQDLSLTNGTERSWGAGGIVSYVKDLPRDAQLTASYQHQYDRITRNLTNDTRTIVDEPHSVAFGAATLLANTNIFTGSVSVRNADFSVRPTPYVPGLDYEVRQVGAQYEVVILPGSSITVGTSLLISYDIAVNPRIVYDMTTQGVAVDLWLNRHQQRLFGRVDWYSQDLLEGRDDLLILNSGYIIHAGIEDNLPPLMYQVNYEGANLDTDKHDSFEGRVQHVRTFPRGTLSLNLFERYTITRPNSATARLGAGGTTTVNTAGLGATYARSLFSTAYFTASGNYFNTTGDEVSRNDLSLRGDFRWNYGNLQFFLVSQVNFRFDSGRTSSDENLQLQIRRYF